MADLCEQALTKLHARVQESAGTCSAESSFSGEGNDENCNPAPSPQLSTPGAPSPAADSETTAKTQPLSLLQQLQALQTFCACLYTQDIVSEVFIHSIIDHVRFGSAAWPHEARNGAISGVCGMFKFCGKRLETLGTMKAAMPAVYSDLQNLADSKATSASTQADIREVIELRARNWLPEPAPAAAAAAKAEADDMHTDSIAPPEISLAPALKSAPMAAEDVTFTSMLGASGVTLAPVPIPADQQQQAGSGALNGGVGGGFPYLEEADEPAVKMEDMLAAVQGIDGA